MYKLAAGLADALTARTSQDPTDFNSAWDTQTASDDVVIQDLKDMLGDASVLIATFKNGNNILEVVEVDRGDAPAYSGNTPTKSQTASKTYTFNGWSPEITSNYKMTDNTIFTAQFTEAPREYTITFQDYDESTVLQTKSVAYGTVPEYTGETPTREGYTFTGWTPELASVTGNATYVATYEEATEPAE